MAALRDLAERFVQGMIPKLLVSGASMVVLAAVGCQGPDRVIDVLPAPTTGYRPQPPRPTPRPAPQPKRTASVPWWKWKSKPAPPPVRSSIGEPGWVPASGISNTWACIVIHHSANDKDTPKSMDAWHRQRGWDGLGYHFVIGNGVGYRDGQVFVGPRWTRQATGAHCKTPGAYYNEHGIGICLIGNMENHRPSERQMQSLAQLVAFLQRQRGIPNSKILMHGHVTHKTACPGRYFSIADLMRRLNSGP